MGFESIEMLWQDSLYRELRKDKFVSFTETDEDNEDDTSCSTGKTLSSKSRCLLVIILAAALVIGGAVTGTLLARSVGGKNDSAKNASSDENNVFARPTMAPTTKNPKAEQDGSSAPEPTPKPSLRATLPPTPQPALPPTPQPTLPPTPQPTLPPTPQPTFPPTPQPTRKPTLEPTSEPTRGPTRYPTQYPTRNPSFEPTPNPTRFPTRAPVPEPVQPPVEPPVEPPVDPPLEAQVTPPTEPPMDPPTEPPVEPPVAPPVEPPVVQDIPDGDAFQVVLQASQYLENGEYVQSPNSLYSLGLSESGHMVMRRDQQVVWQSARGSGGNARLWMQPDGNVIIRNSAGEGSWLTETGRFPGAVLVISNRGEMSVIQGGVKRWLDGNPRSSYRGQPSGSPNLAYPIRGTFYYPWFPDTWTVGGKLAHFEPMLGYYSSSDVSTAVRHINELDYAHIGLSIASWWGPDTNLDKARLTMLMDKTIESDSNLKWSLYQEDEFDMNQSPGQIRDDLNYIKKWFAWHDAFAHIDNRPLIFVYNEAGCDVARRWMEASGGEFYIVLKLFIGYLDCPIQPDRWHQYGPATEELGYDGVSYSISPGFYQANHEAPTLDRVSEDRWRQHVQNMVDSRAPFQLLTTYNEYGEGTAIESSREWASSSGYGYYLDALHDIR